MVTVERYLEVFDRRTEKLVAEILVSASLAELQELFGVAAENPMYDCCPVQELHVEFLEQRTRERLDLESFDYYVAARAVS